MKTQQSRISITFIGLLMALLSMLLFVNPAQAFHFPWDQAHDTTDYNDPDNPGPPDDPNNKCGKGQSSPVYTAQGYFIWTDTDLVLAGRPTIDISRTYNSHDPRDGVFGNGWSSGCEESFKLTSLVSAGGSATTPELIYIHKVADGKRYEYKQDSATGNYIAPAGQPNNVIVTGLSVRLVSKLGSFKEFDAAGRLIKGQTEDGLIKSYEYDSAGKITKISSDNRFVALSYDSNGRVANIQDHAGRTWTYGYDTDGNLVSVSDPLGGVRRYEYQPYSDPVDGFTYYQLTRITDETNVIDSQVVYNQHRVTSYTVGSNTYTYSYNTANKLVTKTDATSRIRTFRYDDRELVTELTDPLRNTAKKEYDSEGNLVKYTDKLGNLWESTFSTGNRLLSTKSPLGRVSQYEFTGENPKPSKIITAAGNTTTISYDEKLHPVQIADAKNNTALMTYDANGNISSITDAKGDKTTITYNAANKPLTYTDAKGNITTNTYDNLQRLTSLTDPEGRTTTYEYDLLDRLVKTTNSLGHITRYTYDASGRLLTLTDPKANVTTSAYDSFGRLIQETRPDGRFSQYTYDAANLVTAIALYDGKTISIGYDLEERISSSSVDGDTINYSHNARGDLTQISNATATISYTYSADGEQIQEVQAGITLDRLYNADSSLIQLKVLGQTLDYNRDALNLVTKLSNGADVFDLVYDANSLLTSVSMPNGTSENYTRDQNYNITRILTGSNILDYNYDKNDQITQKTLNGNATSYSYDDLSRLTLAGSDSYSYDTAGNNLNNGAKYDLNTNQLTQDNTYNYSYDASGNLLQKKKKDGSQTKNYSFNTRNQLIKVETLDATDQVTKTLEFSYDPFGRRFSKSVDGTLKRYVYSGDNIIAIVDNGGNTLSTFNTLGVDRPLSITTGANTYYYHRDHQGSIISLSDSGGNNIETYAYDAYGVTSKTTSAVTGNPFAFTGREFDDDDLYYYRARYYDPQSQRFISQDPIEFSAGDYNFYRYVFNNPVNLTDPSGEIVPLLFGLYALIETGLSIYDAYDTARTLLDPCASGTDKLVAAGLFLGGLIAPGGGYSKADDIYDAARRACCFVAGTQVQTENGFKNIEDIGLGDRLWSKNIETGEQDWKLVTKIFNEARRDIYEIKLLGIDGFVQKIEATDDHPFYVQGQGWKTTFELVAGDYIETDRQSAMSVISVIDLQRKDFTYNFEVADYHTYYVTERNVLVHNCNVTKGLETRGVRPAPGERTIQGQVDAATQAGNPTVQRGGQDLFRLRSSGHGQTGATATPQNVRNVSPDGNAFTGKGPDRNVTPRDIRELHKAQTGQGTSTIRTRSGR